MSQSNFDLLLQRYLRGECTEEEKQRVLEWYESLVQDSELNMPEPQKAQIETRLWDAITTTIQTEEQPTTTIIPLWKRRWAHVAVACIVVLIAGASIILYNNRPTTPGNQQVFLLARQSLDSVKNTTAIAQDYTLTDGSVLTLQPGAVVYHPAAFNQPTRDVYLTGSAFFKVYHNPQQHFIVHMYSGLTTEVLGTSFAITQNAGANDVEVAVVTGKVLVYKQLPANATAHDSANVVLLTRNKKVTYNTTLSRFITGIVANPIPGVINNTSKDSDKPVTGATLNFEETPLRIVLQTLSDTYGLDIISENEQLGDYHFRGNLASYNLFTQLEIICQSTQTKYEINGTQIIIKQE
jgi:transmembrane sensor